MAWPGSKNGSGVYQRIINLMPPHRVYIEPFLGGGAIMTRKLPAKESHGCDLDPAALRDWTVPGLTVHECCGLDFVDDYRFRGGELIYFDPPYIMATRSGRRLYLHEMGIDQHGRLLDLARAVPARVMISGYMTPRYASALRDWSLVQYTAMTRGGPVTECLWFNFDPPDELHDYRYLGRTSRTGSASSARSPAGGRSWPICRRPNAGRSWPPCGKLPAT